MSHGQISLADTPPQPWRNGAGSSRELLAWPSAAAWQVRLSVADIATDAPFSAFSGVTRWFAVLQGAGVALTIDGRLHVQRLADAPLRFDGGAATNCRLLDGATRDLNLMLRQRTGGLLEAQPGQPWQPPGPVCGLFTRVAGQCQAAPAFNATAATAATTATTATTASNTPLPALALLWFDRAPAHLTWQPALPPDPDRPTPPQAWWLWASHQTPCT